MVDNDGGKETESVRKLCGGGVFLVLTILLTVYFPFHLAATGSILTYLLTIPTMVICVGCWVAFIEARSKQRTAAGLSMISGGLLAQMLVLLAYGIVFAIFSAVSFIQFLNIDLDITIAGSNLHLLNVGETFVEYFRDVLVLLVLACAVLVVYGLLFVRMLGGFRRSAKSVKSGMADRYAEPQKPARAPGLIVLVVIVAAGSAVRLYFANGIYTLFSFLNYPGYTLANGISDRLFPGRWGDTVKEILNSVVSYFRDRNDIGNDTTNAIRDFFLASLGRGGAENAQSGVAIAAGILLLCVLICVIVLLAQSRRVAQK